MNFMKGLCLSLVCILSMLYSNSPAWGAEELYVITTKDGSAIVVKNYTYTDKLIEFTTESGLPGFIKKTEFVSISNMVGVPPLESELVRERVSKEERNKNLVLLTAAALVILIVIMLVYLSARRKKVGSGGADIYYGRRELNPVTQGHLSFEYKGALGRRKKWTIEVRSAYEEDGSVYVEGICTTTEKRKTFSADRVVGPVTDMSSEHHAPMGHFFVDAKEGK